MRTKAITESTQNYYVVETTRDECLPVLHNTQDCNNLQKLANHYNESTVNYVKKQFKSNMP